MLRVTTLYAASAAATAAYYTHYLTAAPGEVPGVWAGRQAAGLGLSGEVDAASLQALLEGRDPHSGTPLGRALTDSPDGRVRAVAGFDATFSAPKSVSVLWALTQDRRLLEAHDVAVTAALAHLERFGSTTRIRVAGGRLHPDTGGLSMAVFRQTTSRAELGDHPGDGLVDLLDVIVTRRNNRQIHTIAGEPIRNRELWTITAIDKGALHVTSRHGTDHTVLPADYVAEHVQLGYAATEHGNQSDTVDIGVELVTAATGRRGLYVGATRGRDTNMLLVVTNDHDPDTARDLLHTVLASDRPDLPATAQHRNLAQTDRRPNQPTPRCQIPTWFHQLQQRVHSDLAAAQAAAVADRRRITDLEHDLADAHQQLAAAEQNLDPYRPTLAAADRDVAAAREQQLDAYSRLRHSGRLAARSARRDVAAANNAHETALARRRDTQAAAQPAQDAYNQAQAHIRGIKISLSGTRTLNQWNGSAARVNDLGQLANALDHWHQWANGHTVPPDAMSKAAGVFRQHGLLRTTATDVAAVDHSLVGRDTPRQPAPPAMAPVRQPDIGIEL